MRLYNWIWISLILLFIFETTVIFWMIPASWQDHRFIGPHFVFVIMVYIALYRNRHLALAIGMVFGLLHDVLYYGYMIGPFCFGMGLIGYLVGLIFKRAKASFFISILVQMMALISFELILYGLYRLFRVVEVPIAWAMMNHMLPSLLFNLFFALIAYIPIRYVFDKMTSPRKPKEQDY